MQIKMMGAGGEGGLGSLSVRGQWASATVVCCVCVCTWFVCMCIYSVCVVLCSVHVYAWIWVVNVFCVYVCGVMFV